MPLLERFSALGGLLVFVELSKKVEVELGLAYLPWCYRLELPGFYLILGFWNLL